jgi:hypothetical protein
MIGHAVNETTLEYSESHFRMKGASVVNSAVGCGGIVGAAGPSRLMAADPR